MEEWSNFMSVFDKACHAVIDIGSNSVRLVIYAGPARCPVAIFNEKAQVGLGKRDQETGALCEAAMRVAIDVLERFSHIIKANGSPPCICFATAAVRDAPNGEAFVEQLKSLGLTPKILGGREEARLAALGVQSGHPFIDVDLKGGEVHLCADMGGGSLDITQLSGTDEEVQQNRLSLNLGPLSLIAKFGPDPKDAISYTNETLQKYEWISNSKVRDLYAVGGGWRAVAKVNMALRRYPLSILHHYFIPAADVIETCQLLQRQSTDSLAITPGVQKSRIETLPHAAMVLLRTMKITGAEGMILSATGVREGVLFDALDTETQKQDPLLVLAQAYAKRLSPHSAFAEAATGFTQPIFKDQERSFKRLRKTIGSLGEVASLFHTDMRADQGCEMVLRAPFTGISHQERVMMAAAIYYRYKGRKSLPAYLPTQLMNYEQSHFVLKLGLALRFASDFASRSIEALNDCQLTLENETLTLGVPEKHEALISAERPLRKLRELSEVCEAEPALDIYEDKNDTIG